MDIKKDIFILLHGEIEAGKDTTGDYLVKNYGYTKISYAEPLKDLVAPLYNINREDMDSKDGKLKPLLQLPAIMTNLFTLKLLKEVFKYLRTADGKGVKTLSEIGTDRFDSKLYILDEEDPFHVEILHHTPRSVLILEGCLKIAIDPYFWVQQAYEKLPKESPLKVVVTDFRFPAEYYCTLEKYGKTSLIFPILIYNPEVKTTPTDVSQSSLISFTFDYKLENTKKSLELYYAKVDEFMAMLTSSGYQ